MVSLVCVVHCVILPVTMTTLSLAGMEIMHNLFLETMTILAAAITGSMAMWKGYQKHGMILLSIIFVIGIALMIAGNTGLPGSYELIVKCLGAVLVISAHVRNYLLSRLPSPVLNEKTTSTEK